MEDREESFASDVERNAGIKSDGETKRNSTIFDSNAKVFVLGVLLGCFVRIVNSVVAPKRAAKVSLGPQLRGGTSWTYRKRVKQV